MTIRAVTYYQAVCDYPDCGNVDDEGEFSAWSDADVASELAVGSGWHSDLTADGTEILYCPTHVTFDEDLDEEGVRLPDGRWIAS